MNDLPQDLITMLDELNILQNKELKKVKKQITDIISNNIIDEKLIENTFDRLLDLTYFFGNDMSDIYYTFLDYYSCINLEASNDYETFYLEIIGDNEKNMKKINTNWLASK